MATKTYASIVPDVLIYANGCPAPTITDVVAKTANDFFYQTLAYRVWTSTFDLTISTTNYDLNARCPADTEVAQVLALKCQGLPVNEVTHEEFFMLDPKWPSLTGSNAQYYTIVDNKDSFNIIPSPEATVSGAFNLLLAVTPTLTATQMEETPFLEWKDAIVAGALARLLAMPERPWSDPKRAVEAQRLYVSEIVAAKAQANKGNVRRDLNVQMRRWV